MHHQILRDCEIPVRSLSLSSSSASLAVCVYPLKNSPSITLYVQRSGRRAQHCAKACEKRLSGAHPKLSPNRHPWSSLVWSLLTRVGSPFVSYSVVQYIRLLRDLNT